MNIYRRIALSALATAAIAVNVASAQYWATSGNTVGTNDFLGATNVADLVFKTNNIERMRITSGGLVGIGTASPLSLFHVENNGAPQLRLSDVTGISWDFWAGDNLHFRRTNGVGYSDWMMFDKGNNAMRIGPNSEFYINTGTHNVGIGTTSTLPGDRITVAGNITPATSTVGNIGAPGFRWSAIWASNGTIQTSDARMKEDVADLDYGLDEVMKLHPVSFTWKNDPAWGKKIGLLAQEVREVLPEIVKGDEDGTSMGIFYSGLVPVLIRAVQQQEDISVASAGAQSRMVADARDLDARLARIEEALGKLSGVDAPALSVNGIMLEQNDPNPTGSSTTISYRIPASVAKAELVISEITTGREISRTPLSGRENGEIKISVADLSSGTYLYSVVADGKLSASRKMVVTK